MKTNKANLLHVHGQTDPHDAVVIKGTIGALEALAGQIRELLEEYRHDIYSNEKCQQYIDSHGEYYNVAVEISAEQQIKKEPPPWMP